MQGTITVDFAGTPEEAGKYAAEHQAEFPNLLTNSRAVMDPNLRNDAQAEPKNRAILIAKFNDASQMLTVQELFGGLGYPLDDQLVRCWKSRKDKKELSSFTAG